MDKCVGYNLANGQRGKLWHILAVAISKDGGCLQVVGHPLDYRFKQIGDWSGEFFPVPHSYCPGVMWSAGNVCFDVERQKLLGVYTEGINCCHRGLACIGCDDVGANQLLFSR